MGSPPGKIKDGRNAFIVSVAIVLFCVGTNYIGTTYGRLGELGDSFEIIGLFLALPPAISLLILSGTGMEIPSLILESLVESDIWIWIYWVLFYTFCIYFIIRSWKIFIRYRYSKKVRQQQAS